MILWDDSILLGIAEVDRDHKDILAYINAFIAEVEAGRQTGAVHAAFRRMELSIYQHLAFEEDLLEQAGYEHLGNHQGAHERLLDDLQAVWDGMLADPDFQPDAAARAWLETWLFDHVRNEDFRYRDKVIKAGLGRGDGG